MWLYRWVVVMKLDDSTEIKSVSFIDVSNGKEIKLSKRVSSHCPFYWKFPFQNYFIQLRLDWSDVRGGDPVLDADIWTESNGKKNFLKKGPWHNNEKKLNSQTNEI